MIVDMDYQTTFISRLEGYVTNTFFSIGVNFLQYEHLTEFRKTNTVFLDLSIYNLEFFLKNSTFEMMGLEKENDIVIICDKELLPLGLFFFYNIKPLFLFMSETPVDKILERIANNDRSSTRYNRHKALSKSEYEIFQEIYLKTNTVKEIAYKRNKDVNTIYDLRKRLIGKIDFYALMLKKNLG